MSYATAGNKNTPRTTYGRFFMYHKMYHLFYIFGENQINMKHSPAPWKWSYDEYEYPNLPLIKDANGDVVCDFGDDMEFYPTAGTVPNPVNAALIAAAPELLEACKKVLGMLQDAHGSELKADAPFAHTVTFYDEIEILESAIAKAQPTEINETT